MEGMEIMKRPPIKLAIGQVWRAPSANREVVQLTPTTDIAEAIVQVRDGDHLTTLTQKSLRSWIQLNKAEQASPN
jgi:hypothetical protein